MWSTDSGKAFRAELGEPVKGSKKKKAKGAQGKGGGKGTSQLDMRGVPRMMCHALWTKGSCPKSLEGWHCPYNHYNPDQVIVDADGYWRPKAGQHRLAAGDRSSGVFAMLGADQMQSARPVGAAAAASGPADE